MEESINIYELNLLVDSFRKETKQEREFLAAMQGIDLNKGQSATPDFDEVKRRAQARISGKSEEELDLAEIGFEIGEWEDELT